LLYPDQSAEVGIASNQASSINGNVFDRFADFHSCNMDLPHDHHYFFGSA